MSCENSFKFLKLKKYLETSSFKTVTIFTGGNFIVAVVSAISGLLYGNWIDPATLGEFRKYNILTGYLGFGIVLVSGAFQRHFTYYLGKKDQQKALEIASYTKWWYIFLNWVGIFIFSTLTIYNLFVENFRASLGWFIQIPAYGVATYVGFLKVFYRSNDDFLKLNKINIIKSATAFISLPIIYFYQYWGLASRSFLIDFADIFMHSKYSPFKVKAKYNFRELKNFAKISVPLQIPTYFDNILLKTTLSYFVLKYYDEDGLGIYSMALMIQGFILIFSSSINQIFTTKIMLKFGSNDSITKTFRYIIKPVILVSFAGLITVLTFNYFANYYLMDILPKFTASVPVLTILTFELVTKLLSSPFEILNAALYLKTRIILRFLKVISTIIIIIVLAKSLENIALSIIMGQIIAVILGYTILLSIIKKENNKTDISCL